jgi:hypothetical protein
MGSSLLKAHQWAKSQLARANPSGGAQDYTIQSVDGTPLTLSDLTNDSYDEVLLIGSVKNNPSKTTNYPAVYPSFNYPSYTRRPSRVGNRVPELLAEDIEPAMVERLVAQRGYFGGLNLIVKLQNTSTRAEQYTSPKFASLLQKTANASRRVKSNPGQVLYTSVNNTNAGILTSGEATRSFFKEYFGITGPNATNKITNWSKEVRKYGLDDTVAFDNFVNEVLEPFLVVSTANVGLLKTLRLPENSSYLLEKINKKSRNKYAVFEDTPIYQKLMTYLPIKSQDFYEGIDYALVAHPYFAYEELAKVMVNKKFMDNLFKVLEEAPQSFMKRGTSRNRLAVSGGGFRARISRLLKIGDQYLYDSVRDGQFSILKESKNKDQSLDVNTLREMMSADLTDVNRFVDKLPGLSNKVVMVNGLAGFPTTPPPYWPRPIAYAVMDTILENLQKILTNVNDGGMQEALSKSLALTLGVTQVAELLTPADPVEVEKKVKVGRNFVNKKLTTDHFGIYYAYMYMNDEDVQKFVGMYITPPSPPDPAFPPINLKDDESVNAVANVNDRDGVNAQADYAKIIAWLGEPALIREYNKLFVEGNNILETDNKDYLVPLMTLFAAVEEYSTNKYGHSVLEGERVFILELLRKSLESLRIKSGSANTAYITSGLSESKLRRIVREICQNSQASENEVLTFLTFKANYEALKSAAAARDVSTQYENQMKRKINDLVNTGSVVYQEYVADNPISYNNTVPTTAQADRDELKRLFDTLASEYRAGDAGLQYITEDVKDKIIEPGVTMRIDKVNVTLAGLNEEYFDQLIAIMKELNETTESVMSLISDYENPGFRPFMVDRDISDNQSELHQKQLGDYLNSVEDFTERITNEMKVIEVKVGSLQTQLTNLKSSISNTIPATTSTMKNNYESLVKAVGRLETLVADVKTKMATLGGTSMGWNYPTQITDANFDANRTTYLEEATGTLVTETVHYPRFYYSTLTKLLEIFIDLEPIQSDLTEIYTKFEVKLPTASAEEMASTIISLADALELRGALLRKPESTYRGAGLVRAAKSPLAKRSPAKLADDMKDLIRNRF